MAVSANTLFHFTSLDTLAKIIKNKGLWPRYSKEHFSGVLPDYSFHLVSYIPMVSFCDLRLTQLSNPSISIHTQDFGMYGIGFYKDWGLRKGISPVVYVNSKSITSRLIKELFDNIRKTARIENGDLDVRKVRETIPGLIKFLKPYEGYYQKGRKQDELRRYYDEREWRYVPGDNFPVISKESYSARIVESLNKESFKNLLTFSATDVKFIILKSDQDKAIIANAIRKSGFNPRDKTDLLTKVITLHELNDDY